MPIIPTYQRRMSITGEGPNALQDVGSAGLVGNSIARMGKEGAEILFLRAGELNKQRQDNILIEKGSMISDDVLSYELNYQKENKGVNASDSQKRVAEYTATLFDKYKVDGDEVVNTKIKQHIAAHDQSLKVKLGGYEAAELNNYGKDVRALDLESSAKMAQNGEVDTAIINYKKTLDTQKTNYSLSEEDYQIEMKKGVSAIYESYINSLLVSDPVSAKEVFKVAKKDLLTNTQERLEKIIAPAVTLRTGMDAGVEIFKADKTGSIESMTDAVRAKKLDAETEKVAIGQVKELYNERKVDEEKIQKDAIKEVNEILVPIALGRNGLNKQSDLTRAQWTRLMDTNPEYAAKLQDNMRKELDYQTRQNKAEATTHLRDKRLQQADNESLIMISDDFATRDLKSDLSKGNISPAQYRSLLGMQAKLDPMKRDSVKTALSKVDTGIGAAIGVKNKAVQNTWKLKYGDLVKAFAYKNADDPNFDTKLSEFVEKQVLSKMVTSWFSGDEVDRAEKYNKAKGISGELPAQKKGVSRNNKSVVGYKNGKPVYDLGNGKWQVGE